jgi:Membrane dipeptidase (Peptidase family M19)
MISLLLRIERESQGRVRVCRSVSDIQQCMSEGVLAAVLHLEGAEAIDPKFEVLDVLHAAGLHSLGPSRVIKGRHSVQPVATSTIVSVWMNEPATDVPPCATMSTSQ